MKQNAGRNGGTLKSWEKGESGNPRGRMKGMTHWYRELHSKKNFVISLTMEDEDGDVTEIKRTVKLREGAAKMATSQLLLKASQGDMEAIREMNRMEQAMEDREAAYHAQKEKSRQPGEGQMSMSIPFEIMNPLTQQIENLDICAADEETE